MKNVKLFAYQHPFFASIILAIVWAIIFHGTLAIISIPIIIVGIVLAIKRTSQNSKAKKAEYQQAKITEANAFIEGIKTKKSVPSINSSLLLEKDEHAILEESTKLAETRAVSHRTGSGIGFRVMKGVYVGSYAGQSESTKEWRAIDQGTVTLTNKRILFKGNKENRTIPISKILSIDISLDSFQVSVDGKAKSESFTVNNGYIWTGALHIIRAADDPFHLGDMKINIEFK
ncbi:MAG: hypothetical protein WCT02_04080 [Candidatus Paceibacterota bacterium]